MLVMFSTSLLAEHKILVLTLGKLFTVEGGVVNG